MRLFHKDLIPVLPRQQLLGQWRECCLIAKQIHMKGNPNHILVNKIMDYPKWHFMSYAILVAKEMERRKYKVDRYKFFKWFDLWNDGNIKTHDITKEELFSDWHNNRYLRQCYHNLQEKYDCGGINDDEWKLIREVWLETMRRFQNED